MGHLNVSFYVAKAMEALVGLAAELGMPHAFAPHAEATLTLRELHIRFLREAREGARLHIEGGVVELGDEDAHLLFLMRHHTGELAATFQMRVAHVTAREGRAFPWPAWARARAAALPIEIPEKAQARSLAFGAGWSPAGLDPARALRRTGLGAVRSADVDPFGRMRPDRIMARVYEGMAPLLDGALAHLAAERVGGVALEYRFVYPAWARIGDRLEVRSAFTAADARLRRMAHWVLDPHTGQAWAAAEVMLVGFDLEARKMISLEADELSALQAIVRPGPSI